MSKALLGWTAHYDDGTQEKFRAEDMVTLLKTLGLRGGGGKYNYINADACPVHGPWRAVKSGISKSTGRPYKAFYACDQPQDEDRCTNRPHHDWEETHPIEPSGADQAASPEPMTTPAQTAGDFDDLPF